MSKQAVATVEAPTVPAQSNSLTPMEMLDRAVQSGAAVETIEKLMTLQERWEKNEARKAFEIAVSEAKAEIKPVVKNRTGHNSKRYADFAAIATAVDPILTRHGLNYRFQSEQGERVTVTCILAHRLGHSEKTTLSGPADKTGSKNDVQAIGSTLTYLQRYTLVQMLGLAAADDDDGAATTAISPEQLATLQSTIVEVGADIAKFCTAFSIEKVDDLPAKRFQEALDRLNNYGKQRK